MILVGNKCDLEFERKVRSDYGFELARAWNIPFIETSAKDRTNVENVLQDE